MIGLKKKNLTLSHLGLPMMGGGGVGGGLTLDQAKMIGDKITESSWLTQFPLPEQIKEKKRGEYKQGGGEVLESVYTVWGEPAVYPSSVRYVSPG